MYCTRGSARARFKAEGTTQRKGAEGVMGLFVLVLLARPLGQQGGSQRSVSQQVFQRAVAVKRGGGDWLVSSWRRKADECCGNSMASESDHSLEIVVTDVKHGPQCVPARAVPADSRHTRSALQEVGFGVQEHQPVNGFTFTRIRTIVYYAFILYKPCHCRR